MNTISPQQVLDHAHRRRDDLVDELRSTQAHRRTRPGRSGSAAIGRSSSVLATAAFGAAAFIGGGLLQADAATAKPPAVDRPDAMATVAMPDCDAETGQESGPANARPTHDRRDRLDPIAV